VISSNTNPLTLTWDIPAGGVYDSLTLTNLTTGNEQTLLGDAITATELQNPELVNNYTLVGNYYALQTAIVSAVGYVGPPPPLLTLTATQSVGTPTLCQLSWSYSVDMANTSAPYTDFNIYVGGVLVAPSPVALSSNPQNQSIALDPATGPYNITMTGVSALGESDPILVVYTPTPP
jgi:hypothetical protein